MPRKRGKNQKMLRRKRILASPPAAAPDLKLNRTQTDTASQRSDSLAHEVPHSNAAEHALVDPSLSQMYPSFPFHLLCAFLIPSHLVVPALQTDAHPHAETP